MMGHYREIFIEAFGWSATVANLAAIVMPNRKRLHQLGAYTAVSTGVYAHAHGATAIWVKWLIAFFFHVYMFWKIHTGRNLATTSAEPATEPAPHPA